MTSHSLHRFFHPERIAVFGATPKAVGIRTRFLEALIGGGYTGDVIPINPSHKEVHGRRCYPNIIEAAAEAKGRIDLAANRNFKRRFPHAGTVFPILRAVNRALTGEKFPLAVTIQTRHRPESAFTRRALTP